MKRLTTETFKERALQVFPDRFDYSQTVYENMRNEISVMCKEHGKFYTFPQNHLRGVVSCTGCNGQGAIPRREFIERSKSIFKDFLNNNTVHPILSKLRVS